MRRREFITLIGGAAAVWPMAASAQQAAMPVVGYLSSGSAKSDNIRISGFRQGLAEEGYVEGRNVIIEYRWADNQFDRLHNLANELVRHQARAIVAISGNATAHAAKTATTTIPIVFLSGTDPVKSGLVASLGRPGGNLTGVSVLGPEMEPKRLGLLHELVPQATVIAALVNPEGPSIDAQSKDLESAARAIGRQIILLNARSARDIEAAFASFVQHRITALLVTGNGLFFAQCEQLTALALRHAVPAIYEWPECAQAGGLLSYGSTTESYRQVGVYAGRVLKGIKPADLPVLQPTKFELVINLKTAKALGLEIPPTLLARADEVIE
jgi:putative tryptophan/tyrosine transport system substrate-binding protein